MNTFFVRKEKTNKQTKKEFCLMFVISESSKDLVSQTSIERGRGVSLRGEKKGEGSG